MSKQSRDNYIDAIEVVSNLGYNVDSNYSGNTGAIQVNNGYKSATIFVSDDSYDIYLMNDARYSDVVNQEVEDINDLRRILDTHLQ